MAERKSILLRLRPELYEALQRWAQDEFRSVNGQIEFALQQSLARAGRTPRAPHAPESPGVGGVGGTSDARGTSDAGGDSE